MVPGIGGRFALDTHVVRQRSVRRTPLTLSQLASIKRDGVEEKRPDMVRFLFPHCGARELRVQGRTSSIAQHGTELAAATGEGQVGGGACVVVGVWESHAQGEGKQEDDKFAATEERLRGHGSPGRRSLGTQHSAQTLSVEQGEPRRSLARHVELGHRYPHASPRMAPNCLKPR